MKHSAGIAERAARLLRRALELGSDRQFLVAVLAAATLIRLLVLSSAFALGMTSQETDEWDVAHAMQAGYGFAFDYYGHFDEEPEPGAFFPPAYVFNVYWLLEIFGSSKAVFVQNLLLSVAVCFMLYRLAYQLLDRTAARIALVLSALYLPFFIRLTHYSPVYFKMLLMVLLVYMVSRAFSEPTTPRIVGGGMVAGVLALSMPDILLYAMLISLLLVVGRSQKFGGVRHAVLFLLVTFAMVLPWTLRNYVVFDERVLVSSNGGYNFYMGHNADTKHEVDDPGILRLDDRLGGELARADEFERDRILFREGLAYVRAEPGQTFVNMTYRGVLHWILRPTNLTALRTLWTEGFASATSYQVYTALYAVAYAPLFVLALAGVWLTRNRWWSLAPVLATFAYSMAIAMLFVVQTKMRLIKVEPFLVLFAAAAIAHLLTARGDRGREGSEPF